MNVATGWELWFFPMRTMWNSDPEEEEPVYSNFSTS
jgi:hypothetical protein